MSEMDFLERVIDCDAPPRIPWPGWQVARHYQCGQFTWSPNRIQLCFPNNQIHPRITGPAFSNQLEDKIVANTNVLDYLLEDQRRISREWRVKGLPLQIGFWGTVYWDSNGYACIRCLVDDVVRWRWDSVRTDQLFGWLSPAAVLV